MKYIKVAAARHDAEWLLQSEKVTNDIAAKKERRKLAAKPSKARQTTIRLRLVTFASRSITDRLIDAGHHLGATESEIDMVLEMVGLTDATLASTYNAKGEPKRPSAYCRECGRTIKIRTDGAYISHPVQAKLPLNDDTRCPGSGKPADAALRPAPGTPAPAPKRAASKQPRYRSGQRKNPLPEDRAACQDADPDLFFPPTYGDAHAEQVRQAKRVCRSCPLIAKCLRYAIDNDHREGVWGGTTPFERQALARKEAA